MKIDRPAPSAETLSVAERWNRFWFTPTAPAQLHRLRVLAGLLFLGWLLAFAAHRHELLSLQGLFDREAYGELAEKERDLSEKESRPVSISPAPIGWSIFYLAGDNSSLFDALYWGSVVILTLFILGIAPRITGILTWIVVVSATANPATSYDADFLLVIFAFYLMLGYLFHGLWYGEYSIIERILGTNESLLFWPWLRHDRRETASPSYAANVAVRLVQVHFAIIVVTSALANLQNPDWWSGVAYWYPLHPPFQTSKAAYEREAQGANFALGLLSFAEYVALAWQIGFPAFAWRRGRWRLLLVGGGVVAWFWMMAVRGQPLFGPIYFIGCLSYLQPDEWRGLRSWLPQRSSESSKPISQKVKVEAR